MSGVLIDTFKLLYVLVYVLLSVLFEFLVKFNTKKCLCFFELTTLSLCVISKPWCFNFPCVTHFSIYPMFMYIMVGNHSYKEFSLTVFKFIWRTTSRKKLITKVWQHRDSKMLESNFEICHQWQYAGPYLCRWWWQPWN